MRGLARLIVLAAAAATASAFVPTTSSLGFRRHAVGAPLPAGHGRSQLEARRRARCVVTAEAAHVTIAREKIQAALSPVELEVMSDETDPNGSHISIRVVSEAFEGKRSMARQQLVYKAIWEEMDGSNAPIHAVDSMVCKTPSEA